MGRNLDPCATCGRVMCDCEAWWDDMTDDEKDATLNSAWDGKSDSFNWMDEGEEADA